MTHPDRPERIYGLFLRGKDVPVAERERWLAQRAPWLADLRPPGGRAAALVCDEQSCLPPVEDPAALRALLASPAGAGGVS